MKIIRFSILIFNVIICTSLYSQRVDITDYKSYVKGQDWAPAFQVAFTEGDMVFIPEGNYYSSEVNIPSNRTIVGEGDKTQIHPLGKYLFKFEGTESDEIYLTKDVADFSNELSLEKTDVFQANDDILLVGQRNSLMLDDCGLDWVLGRTKNKTCPFGEFLTVAEVRQNSLITTSNTTYPAYYKDNSRETILDTYAYQRKGTSVRKLGMIKNSHLRNITIVNGDSCDYAVYFKYAEKCSAEQVKVLIETVRSRFSAFAINWSKFVVCKGCDAQFSKELTDSLKTISQHGFKAYSRYNIYRIMTSYGSGFDSCKSDFSTHGFTITSGSGSIPCMGCYVINCYAENALWAGVAVQQACCNSLLEGNTVRNSAQGVVSGGRNTIIRNNKVYCGLPKETDYYYAHVSRGGTSGVGLFEGYALGSIIENNTVVGARTGIIVTDGYERNNIFVHGNIQISGNEVSDCMNGFLLYKNKYNKTFNDLNIILENNSFFRNKPEEKTKEDMESTYGIKICSGTKGIQIQGNALSQFKYGVFVSSPCQISVMDNVIQDSTYGIGKKIVDDKDLELYSRNNAFVRTKHKEIKM